jgi:hypothetical protein
VRLVRVAMSIDSVVPAKAAFDGESDDPLRLALPGERVASDSTSANVLLVRATPDAADSARARDGAVALVHWPATHEIAAGAGKLAVPPAWTARATPDTMGGLTAGGQVVVAPFERWADYGAPDSTAARVVARWATGEPAAVEEAYGSGCIRTVMVGVPSRGDLVLQPRFARLVTELTGSCSAARTWTPMDSTAIAALAGTDVGRYATRNALQRPEVVRSPLVPLLFAAALIFALTALLIQRRVAGRASASLGGTGTWQ